jgi:anti-anti-sigma factor
MTLAQLKLEQQGPLVYASLRGDIDMSNADELRSELTATTPNSALSLILDLTDVHYLDSAGIHLIHRLREDLRSSGQRLQLVIPQSSMINATLRLAGLDWRGDTVETASAAREALEQS